MNRIYTVGWKYNNYEQKGIPFRLEIGERELEQQQILVVNRSSNKKELVKETEMVKYLTEEFQKYDASLFNLAKSKLEASRARVETF